MRLDEIFMYAEVVAGVVFMVCAILAWAAMSTSTRHCFRFVYGLIGVAGFIMVLRPMCDLGTLLDVDLLEWARMAVLLAFALYMILDRRRIRPEKVPKAIADVGEATLIPGSSFRSPI